MNKLKKIQNLIKEIETEISNETNPEVVAVKKLQLELLKKDEKEAQAFCKAPLNRMIRTS